MLTKVTPHAAHGTHRAGLPFGVLLSIFCVAAYTAPLVITSPMTGTAGWYTFAGRPLAAMKDFDSISLLVISGHAAVVAGEVVKRPRTAPLIYKLGPASISGGHLISKTQIAGGVSCRFQSHISKRRLPKAKDGYDVLLLEGRLVKFRSGRRMGEIKGEFKYEEFSG